VTDSMQISPNPVVSNAKGDIKEVVALLGESIHSLNLTCQVIQPQQRRKSTGVLFLG
jgi:hypothetical protein